MHVISVYMGGNSRVSLFVLDTAQPVGSIIQIYFEYDFLIYTQLYHKLEVELIYNFGNILWTKHINIRNLTGSKDIAPGLGSPTPPLL